MKASTRTILAFVVAPSIAPAILGVIAASMRPEGEGPTWVASFAQYFSVAAVVSYAISFTLGTELNKGSNFVLCGEWQFSVEGCIRLLLPAADLNQCPT